MNDSDAIRWVDRLAGVLVGLALGLGWSITITWRLVGLGARMGTEVLKAGRLSAHVSREYQNLKQRVERLERRTKTADGTDIEEDSA